MRYPSVRGAKLEKKALEQQRPQEQHIQPQSVRNRPPPAGASPQTKKAHLDSDYSQRSNQLKKMYLEAERAGDTQKAKGLLEQQKHLDNFYKKKAAFFQKDLNAAKAKQHTTGPPPLPRQGQATAPEITRLEKEKEQMAQGFRDKWRKLTNDKIQAEIAGDTHKAKDLAEQRQQLEKEWKKESQTHKKHLDAAKTAQPATTPANLTRSGQTAAPPPKPAFQTGAAKPPAGMYLTPDQAKTKADAIAKQYYGPPHYIYNDGKIVDVVPQSQNTNYARDADGQIKTDPITKEPLINVEDGYEIVKDLNTGKVFFKKTTAPPPSQVSISPGKAPLSQNMQPGKAPYDPALPAIPDNRVWIQYNPKDYAKTLTPSQMGQINAYTKEERGADGRIRYYVDKNFFKKYSIPVPAPAGQKVNVFEEAGKTQQMSD